MFRSTFSKGAALVALVAAGGLVALACGGEEAVKTPTPTTTAAAQRTTPAGGGAATQVKWPGKEAAIPILGGIPNAPPRATPSPPPPGTSPTPPPPPPTPGPAKVVPLYAYHDTVTSGAGESKYNVDANLSCVRTSVFSRGMQIVWRMEIVDTATGKILQGTDVKDATLKIAGGEEVKFRYGRHGATDQAPWFWTAAWSVPKEFPLGVMDYTITISTQDGKNLVISSLKDLLRVSSATSETAVVIVPAG